MKVAFLEISEWLKRSSLYRRDPSEFSWSVSSPLPLFIVSVKLGKGFHYLSSFSFPRRVTLCLSLESQDPSPIFPWMKNSTSEDLKHNSMGKNGLLLSEILDRQQPQSSQQLVSYVKEITNIMFIYQVTHILYINYKT